MTTPSLRRASAKREQILTAATRLFVRHGYTGTSMDAVVAEAGVSKQTLYRYFPSKADLLSSFITTELAPQEVFTAFPPEPNTGEELRQSLVLLAQSVTGRLLQPHITAALRLVISEAVRIPELRDLVRAALPGQLLVVATGQITRADSLGLISAPRPDLSARLLVGSIFSYVALDGFLRATPLAPPPLADLEFLVDAFLRTVAVKR
ncbi:MAG: TetR/AcrR family transcriptional regulator [Propionicimonas sp.]